jgi:thermolysin
VDAHYYMAHAKEYFENTYSFDFPSEYGGDPVEIHAHYTKNYVNAFWNGRYFAFGDGDGVSYDPLTSMDVAAHEYTHSVTEKINGLIYQNESGALNESFSDIMAAVIERLSDKGVLTPEPDSNLATPNSEWLVGEDFDLVGDGFRNMMDPTADGDPDHYDDRYTGTGDSGGVHINSGIPNHAFYQLVEQGGVDIQRAADIFFAGFMSLPGVLRCPRRDDRGGGRRRCGGDGGVEPCGRRRGALRRCRGRQSSDRQFHLGLRQCELLLLRCLHR